MATATVQRSVPTPDGRILAVEEVGDPDGLPLLVHNGTTNSRHPYPLAVAEPRLLDSDGHLTLLHNCVPEVHAWLAAHAA